MRAGMRSEGSMLSYCLRGFVCLLVVIGFFGLVWLRSSIREQEYEIGALEKECRGVLRHLNALDAEKATLFSVAQTGTVAAEKLGMDFPDRTKVFYVERDRGNVPYEAAYRQ
ncbi:MAG: hypothetical protein M0Z61_13180 [Nitrospiraceae bacterium]|nr:hypothetical protein [Nitrospiraceae bacterium]